MSENKQASEEEPFLLTILPFVGLGLLLVLAVVWRVLPGKAEPGSDEVATASPEEIAEIVIARWDRAPEQEVVIDPDRDFVIGPEDAAVTLVEFSDFECPYCRNAANAVHDVIETYGDGVRLVFKNFPLDTACNETLDQPIHRLACRAATIAWCAGQQDESLFWETHDALFREPQLTAATLERIPADLAIDLDALNACTSSEAPNEAIQKDLTLGRNLGVTGTPIFFANGRRVSDYRRAALHAVVEHITSN